MMDAEKMLSDGVAAEVMKKCMSAQARERVCLSHGAQLSRVCVAIPQGM